MGIMYKFHNKMNHKDFIDEVDNKKTFFKTFNKFCNPAFYIYPKKIWISSQPLFWKRTNQKIVIKKSRKFGRKRVRIFQVQKKRK